MSKRAVLYARVSDDEQVKGFSIPTQLDKMRQYAKQHGFAITNEFVEDFTATRLERPELDKIRDMIRCGEIDVLVVYQSDRFTRDRVHGPLLRAELASLGVELHYTTRGRVEYTPEGELFASIEDNFNAYWREKMLEAATRGRRGKAEAGIIPGQGSVPYGYVKEGKQRDMCLVIVEEHAQIVRDIFQLFVTDDLESVMHFLSRLVCLG
jgi:site-specific DNA recombinase